MKNCNFILVILFIASGCFGEWSSVEWDIFYDGNVLPGASSAIKYSDGSYGSFTAANPSNFTINQTYDGVYRMSTINSNLSAYWSKSLAAPAAISPNSATGYTVEIRARLKDAENAIAGSCSFSMEEATSGVTRYWELKLVENTSGEVSAGISSTTTPVYIPLDHNWHTYRITAADSGVSLYIDGDSSAANSIGVYGTVGLNNIRFGDLTNANDGDWEIDYIGIYSGGAVAVCSDAAHPYSKGDLNKDCQTNMLDFQIFVTNWLVEN